MAVKNVFVKYEESIMFGLNEEDIEIIKNILVHYTEVTRAFIFGSRAKGNFKQGSDVDIALKGAGVDYDIVLQISATLNEDTLMPYHFDVVNYHTIVNNDLISHIDRVGIEFYRKE